MAIKRGAGILCPISSLPSPYGIGSLGKTAYGFIDFLHDAKQSWWQILPVGPTSFGDSPYQSFSSYAGNPYFIDLDTLIEEGLLEQAEVSCIDWGCDASKVDYEKIYLNRFDVLKKAYKRGSALQSEAFHDFCGKNAAWLDDYALFMALKRYFGMKSWIEWSDDAIRLHKKCAVENYTELLADDIDFFKFIQFKFFEQWNKLRSYAHENGVKIIGDMPIYVALDSADVWANPECFMLDEDNVPTAVAGVPPDYFCEDGQLWGNPLYNWDSMKGDGYGWWIRRVGGASKLYDMLRIDHFRAFESYWSVPYGEKTAKNGEWIKGPGLSFVNMLTSWFYNISFIAEDLGILTDDVRQLLSDSGLPGMKVLEFAFDPTEPSNYLPHKYTENCICYIGTHDNAPLMAWFDEATPEELQFAAEYLGLNDEEGFANGIIRGGMSSVASLFVAQIQDYLELGAEARINVPGTPSGNWQWRLSPDMLSNTLCSKIARLTERYGR